MPKQKSFMTCCKKSALSEQRKNGWGSFGCPISRRSWNGTARWVTASCGGFGGLRCGMARRGPERRLRCVRVRRGLVRSVKAVKAGWARRGTAWRGAVRRSWFGSVWSGRVWSVKAVRVRNGLLRQGLAGSSKAVKVCCVRAWRGASRYGGLGVGRSGKSWLGRAVTGYKGESDEVYEKNASRAY